MIRYEMYGHYTDSTDRKEEVTTCVVSSIPLADKVRNVRTVYGHYSGRRQDNTCRAVFTVAKPQVRRYVRISSTTRTCLCVHAALPYPPQDHIADGQYARTKTAPA